MKKNNEAITNEAWNMKLQGQGLIQEDFQYFTSEIENFTNNLNFDDSFKTGNIPFISSCLEKNLLEIAKSALLSNAKRIRPLFCFWTLRTLYNQDNKNYSELFTTVNKIALAIEILHNASLIIDDIEDGSEERRHKVSLHIQYGLPNALNTGSWMYFLALNQLPPKVQVLASKALLDCHVGQALDLSSNQKYFSEHLFSLSENERWMFYENCVELKTTRLMLLSLECLKEVLSMSQKDYLILQKILKKYGILFQIFDDLKNIFPELSGNKCQEDLKTGLRSAISIEFLNLLSPKEKEEAFENFKQNNFFEFMTTNTKYIQAVQNCFLKSEMLLKETELYLDQYITGKTLLRFYISHLFESPFYEVRNKISTKLNEKFFTYQESTQYHENY